MCGGQNPDGYPICVIEKVTVQQAPLFSLNNQSKSPWLLDY
jgi:hypothetical protein